MWSPPLPWASRSRGPAARAVLACALACPAAGCVETGIADRDASAVPDVWVEELFVQEPLPRLDALWVIDDTASMAQEQEALAAGLPGFIEALDQAELDYQVGVVTTDMSSGQGGVLRGNPWIVTPALDDPVSAFLAAAAVGTDGMAPEAGLAAMVAALTDPLRSAGNRGFRRPDAALHVIVVSDDDDDSGAWLSEPEASAGDLLASEAAATGLPAWLSAVVGDPLDGCDGPWGRANPGTTYARVADATGGAIESICEPDLDAIFADMGGLSVQLRRRFSLQAEPVQDSVRVSVDGVRQDAGWVLESQPAAVLFDPPPPSGSQIAVRYRLPETST